MKFKTLHYWHKELLVISFLFFCVNTDAQKLKNEQIDSIYYTIINKIVLKDTIKSKYREKSYREAIVNSKRTQEQRDSIYFEKMQIDKKNKEDVGSVKTIGNRLLDTYRKNSLKKEKRGQTLNQIENNKRIADSQKGHIFLKQNNKRLKIKIWKDIERNGRMSNYFDINKLKNVLNNFPLENDLEKSKIDSFIRINDKGSDFGHMFSAPIIIDDKMMFYHFKMTGKNSVFSRILVYSIKQNKIKFIKMFYQSAS